MAMWNELRERLAQKYTVAHYTTKDWEFVELWERGKPLASIEKKHGLFIVSDYRSDRSLTFKDKEDAEKYFDYLIEEVLDDEYIYLLHRGQQGGD